MALPISPLEIFEVAKFAYDLWKSCKASEGEFEQLGKEVLGMRTIVELVYIECEDDESIINLIDNKEIIRKKLGVYIRNCEQALKSVAHLLKRYEAMSAWDRISWSLWGRAEIASLESNLSSFATQLDSYLQKLELKGIALVNRNVGLAEKNIVSRIGRLEDLLEHFNGDGKAAVTEIMQERQKCGASQKDRKRVTTVMLDYVQEMCQENDKKQRPRTPDPPRGRPQKNRNNLEVPKEKKRALSANSSSNPAGKVNRFSPKSGKAKKPNCTLECWLVQRKSAHALFATFELSEKEIQCRGQWKLREMAEQFNGLPETDRLDNKHGLVNWVLKDRNKKDKDADFRWYPHAAKIERKADLLLGMGIEEQAMVIIKRQMTPSAQKVADEKAAALAEKAAKKANVEKKAREAKAAEAALKRQKKEQAAKIKALEEANRKFKMPQAESKVPGQDKSKEKVTDGVGAPGDSATPSTKDKSRQRDVVKDSKISTPSADDKSTKVKDQATKGKNTSGKASRKHHKEENAKLEPTTVAVVSGPESGASAAIIETDTTKEDKKKHKKEVETKVKKEAGKKDKKEAEKTDKKEVEKKDKEAEKPDRKGKAVADASTPQVKQERKDAEIQALKDENARLKSALQEAGSQV